MTRNNLRSFSVFPSRELIIALPACLVATAFLLSIFCLPVVAQEEEKEQQLRSLEAKRLKVLEDYQEKKQAFDKELAGYLNKENLSKEQQEERDKAIQGIKERLEEARKKVREDLRALRRQERLLRYGQEEERGVGTPVEAERLDAQQRRKDLWERIRKQDEEIRREEQKKQRDVMRGEYIP